jgi:hypothetical protein
LDKRATRSSDLSAIGDLVPKLRWFFATVFLLLFFLLAVANAYSVAASFWHKRHISAVPFFGGIAGVLGFLVTPVKHVNEWWWLPLIVDYGSAPVLLAFFISRLRTAFK